MGLSFFCAGVCRSERYESKNMTAPTLPRREFLKVSGLGLCAIATVPFAAEATPQDVQAAINEIVGAKELKDSDRVVLTLPEIAENGGTVPLTVSIDSPMTDDDHVKAVHIFADANPQPGVASYVLGPYNGKAELSLRMRLMQSQKVVAVAEMSNGEVWVGRKQVKVTLGGCGG